MIRLLVVILALFLLMAFFTRIDFSGGESLMPESLMALGFTLIAAYLIGKMMIRWRLPKITGYLLAGILTGPFVVNLLSRQVVQNLQLIDHLALSLIALTAGGEFRYKSIRPQFKVIGSVILWKSFLTVAGFILFLMIYRGQIGFLQGKPIEAAIGVGIILGAIAVATSPATTIAVITETGARGRFTDFVLGITVFKDIVVVLLFSIALAVATPLILGNADLQWSYIGVVVLEILLSIGVGIAAGFLILLYLKYIDQQTTLFLLGFLLLGIEVSHMFHMEIVLVFMVAGFFVQNFSDKGSQLIGAIKGSSLPIYVIFFAISGASLDFSIFMDNLLLALLIVSLRMFTTFQGTYLGGKLTGAAREITRYGWMGFIGQAGLSLGLSALVAQKIPGIIGGSIRTLIIASIALNQIIGPILFRYSLEKSGEIEEQIY